MIRRVAMLVGFALLGCGGEDSGGGSGSGSCKGTVEGAISGAFTCQAVANYYYSGNGLTEARKNSLVTVLNNEYDATHTRPSGIKNLGTNFEIEGEVKPGSFGAPTLPSTLAYVNYSDGQYFNVIKSITLTLSDVTFQNESTMMDITARIYNLHGSMAYTVANKDGTAEVKVSATF